MRRVTAAFGICSLLVILPAFATLAAEPPSAKDDAKRLLMQAADRGDPNAKEALANLERNLADDAAKK